MPGWRHKGYLFPPVTLRVRESGWLRFNFPFFRKEIDLFFLVSPENPFPKSHELTIV